MSTLPAQLPRNTPTPRCRGCGGSLPPHRYESHTLFLCPECSRFKRASVELRKLAERILAPGDFDALEAAVGRLTDLCLERGL
jgi:predicted RNA-binding Zn-ribbon protein involved in translation (DUF1610 family)